MVVSSGCSCFGLDAGDPLVSLKGVAYRYPGADEPAIDGVDLEFQGGEVTLVTGPLDAGCSTLLIVAAGLVPRVMGGSLSGQVEILGLDARDEKLGVHLAGRVGLLLPTPWTQLSGMAFTVKDEIAFGPSNLGWNRKEIGAAVDRAMEELDITKLADRDPTRLSGGELQKVMMASVVSMNPDVLLLDEPAIELDPRAAGALYELLPALANDRVLVVASTDIDRIHHVADRTVVLGGGRVLGDGPTAEILRNPDFHASTTTVGRVFHAAEVESFPVTIDKAVERFGGRC